LVEQFNLSQFQSRDFGDLEKKKRHTEAPVVIGTAISNTITRAVNTVANEIASPGKHNTLPMFRFTGSMLASAIATFDPAIAHLTDTSSTSIARNPEKM
jgi:preprotein translocase subunit SecF